MINFYFKNKFRNILLLVNKKLSFDKSLGGDFNLKNNSVILNQKNYIYTGCQILNKSIFKNEKIINFPISKFGLI